MCPDDQLVDFFANLTPRQQQTVYLVSQGLSNADAARKMAILPGSVAEYLTIIYGELGNTLGSTQRANRYQLIRCFAEFFERHPDLACPPRPQR